MNCSLRALFGISGIHVRLLLMFGNFHTMEALSLLLHKGLTLSNGEVICAITALDEGRVLTGDRQENRETLKYLNVLESVPLS